MMLRFFVNLGCSILQVVLIYVEFLWFVVNVCRRVYAYTHRGVLPVLYKKLRGITYI